MTIKELIEKFVNGSMTFAEAKKKLRELGQYLDDDEYDKIDLTLETLREIKEVDRGVDHDTMDHTPRPLNILMNDFYMDVFFDCVKAISDGVYPHQIGNDLYEDYGINSVLATYFYNEALDMVRLNKLTPDQIKDIGEEYMRVKFAEMISNGTLRMLSPKEMDDGD
jgi:hypothetical protein